MDLIQHLRVFLRVAETGSFTRAARQLGMASSSTTSAIQWLEARLGTRLFLRSTRQVRLSNDGELLRSRCTALLAEATDIEQLFGNPRPVTGRLRVEVPARMARRQLVPALPALLDEHPGLQLELLGNDRASDPVAEGIDCVLRVGELRSLNLVARELGRLRQVTCAAPSLLGRHAPLARLESITRLPAVQFGRATPARRERLEFGNGAGRVSHALPCSVSVASAEAYIACAREGLGVIQVPRYDVQDLLDSGELVELFPQSPPPDLPMNALYLPQQRASRQVKLFIDWVAGLMQPHLA